VSAAPLWQRGAGELLATVRTCSLGQVSRALYEVGMTGIPVVNVNNNCSTGSTALFLARQAVAAGVVECALAVGFEQMAPGAIAEKYTDRPSPFDLRSHALPPDPPLTRP